MGKMFHALYHDWLAFQMNVVNCATTQATVYCLQSMIVRFGLPKVMVALASLPVTDFKEFVKCNGISPVKISPYYQWRTEAVDWHSTNQVVTLFVSFQVDTLYNYRYSTCWTITETKITYTNSLCYTYIALKIMFYSNKRDRN